MSKIKNISIEDISMPLKEPYQIAYESIDTSPNLLLTLETSDGLIGYGSGTPDEAIGGETVDSVWKSFHEKVEPFLKDENPFRINSIMNELRVQHAHQPSLLAMVDMALYDLLAKKARLPVYQLLGGYRLSIPTSITIGILPVLETIAMAKAYRRLGFSILKVKGGLDVDLDTERMFKIREEFGDAVQLRFDANQGYTIDQTIRFVNQTLDCKIEILEQPTPKLAFADLGAVTQQIALPVMADESLMNLADAFRIAKNGFANMLNIKLMKVGGITHASHINSVAKAAGIEAMVGCMDECALGISAGLHFALAFPNIKYADLDGHLDLVDDPTAGCFRIENGVMFPSDNIGFGWTRTQ